MFISLTTVTTGLGGDHSVMTTLFPFLSDQRQTTPISLGFRRLFEHLTPFSFRLHFSLYIEYLSLKGGVVVRVLSLVGITRNYNGRI